MALTILQAPQVYSPARNPTVFLVNSTDNDRVGFGYFCQLFDRDGELLTELEVLKQPDGNGIIDLSRVLRSYIDNEEDLRPGATSFSAAPNFSKYIDVQFGIQYSEFEFVDSFYHVSGRALFSGVGVHNFEVGDEVTISQQQPYTWDSMNGPAVVMDVPDQHSFTVNKQFLSGPTTPGVAFFSDGSPIKFSGLTGSTFISTGWVLSREEFTAYDSTEWIPTDTNLGTNLLCNAPDGYRVRIDSPMYIPVPNNGTRFLRITTKNRAGETLGVYGIQSQFSPLNAPTLDFCYCGVGPYNIANAASHFTYSGSTTIFGADVHHYYVGFMEDASYRELSTIGTQELRIDLDNRCTRFEEFTLLFLDNRGAWVPMTFPFKHQEQHDVKKKVFSKAGYGRPQGNAWVYRDQDRGLDVYAASHSKSYTLRSDWMTQEEAEYVNELKGSTKAFLIKSPSVYLPIIIDDSKWTTLRWDQQDEMRIELSISMAYDEPSMI